MEERIIDNGFSAHYIKDYHHRYLTEIPEAAAIAWAKEVVPELKSDTGVAFKDMIQGSQWMNKQFVVVDLKGDNWIALAKHDDKFWVCSIQDPEDE